jgi:hypothetical protein
LSLFGQKNLTVGAIELFIMASSGLQLPAGDWKVKHCRAVFALFLRALTDLPAGSKGQELLDASYIKAVLVNELA